MTAGAALTSPVEATALPPLNVAVGFWDDPDGIATGLSHQLRRRGHSPVKFLSHEPPPSGVDVVLAHGPLGSLVPLARHLLAIPAAARPRLALVMSEQLPDPSLPEAWRQSMGCVRSSLDRWAHTHTPAVGWRLRPGTHWLAGRALRYRYYGDLFWLRKTGLLSALAVWSHWTAAFLRERGFAPIVPQRGRNPIMGTALGLERDIDVVWMGKVGSSRRGQLLARLRRELAARGVDLLVIDGVENPYVFGDARTHLLNRTKIMLNLLRTEWDDNSLRYVLAAHNGALLVTEPTLPHTEFLPGTHLVEAPVDRLADTIVYYLKHPTEREQLAANAASLLDGAAPGTGMEQVLALALKHRPLA